MNKKKLIISGIILFLMPIIAFALILFLVLGGGSMEEDRGSDGVAQITCNFNDCNNKICYCFPDGTISNSKYVYYKGLKYSDTYLSLVQQNISPKGKKNNGSYVQLARLVAIYNSSYNKDKNGNKKKTIEEIYQASVNNSSGKWNSCDETLKSLFGGNYNGGFSTDFKKPSTNGTFTDSDFNGNLCTQIDDQETGESWKNYFVIPTNYSGISQHYGIYTGGSTLTTNDYHRGWDLTGSDEQLIYSPAVSDGFNGLGEVVESYYPSGTNMPTRTGSGYNCNMNNSVKIRYTINDQSFLVSFQHLYPEKIVKVGDKISAGQVIGKMGKTGCASGTHLHISLSICSEKSCGFPKGSGVSNNIYTDYFAYVDFNSHLDFDKENEKSTDKKLCILSNGVAYCD